MNFENPQQERRFERQDQGEEERVHEHNREELEEDGREIQAAADAPAFVGIPSIMNPSLLADGDGSWAMIISDEEFQWARAIKASIESSTEIDNLSDFEYTELAIIEQDNLEAAMDRAITLQGFREEFNVRNTLEDAVAVLHQYVSMMPKFFLSFSYNHTSGGYVLVSDLAEYDQQLIRTDPGWQRHVRGIYYMLQSMNPDFHSIREGITLVTECDGFSFSNMDVNVAKSLCTDIFSIYPFAARQLEYFHCSLFLNITVSFVRPLFPKSIRSKFQTGCTFPGGRLDTFYIIPDLETNTKRTIHRMQESARRRYAMTALFKL
ncbi:expressed unknown protein [Seminavis robusta]|uniref:CRAL-TRIO domain-containing protein n=1 Tax=Seminavis robusta TaxID=568900 RepID=A0A9N8EP70_9STRA|nr:expressed unknown protein [Seminavis robusta]|eukprot:Sro1358_g265850.1 n/a (321) ;mRNA; r:5577-6618